MTRRPPRKRISVRHFRILTVAFFVATIVVLLAVSYIAFGTTVVLVTPALQTPSLSIHLTVGQQPKDPKAAGPDVPGIVVSTTVKAETAFTDFTSSETQDARAGGTVTIINTSGKSQALQAGTRLLSNANVLFRTVEAVIAPAKSRVDVAVMADEEGKQGEISPSKFQIVALWESLKTQIYGESAQPMTGGTRAVTRLTQEDLTKAEALAREALKKQADGDMVASLSSNPSTKGWKVLAQLSDDVGVWANAKVGDETSGVLLTAKGTVSVVAVSPTLYETAVTKQIKEKMDLHMVLVDAHVDSATVEIKGINTDQQTAAVDVLLKPSARMDTTSPILDATKMTNMSRSQITGRLGQFEEVTSVEVRFSPFWVFRSPTLADHIKVKLLDAK